MLFYGPINKWFQRFPTCTEIVCFISVEAGGVLIILLASVVFLSCQHVRKGQKEHSEFQNLELIVFVPHFSKLMVLTSDG